MAEGQSLGRAVLTLVTDDAALEKGLKAAEQKTEAFGGKVGSMASKVSAALGGLAIGSMVGVLSDAARGAAEDEANVEKLRVAVENSGTAWGAASDAIERR